ncbi:hypothetical protein WAI453_009573 [Rhynchosporium graminicola]|uniref:Related to rhizopuspepsin-2 n=1 Tax=Rhynchosporium graminicola TaxID=2792576 RepID=A0A1E1KT06_9HELO|nr:related to rhizopuspepsin-2 precursor [Rhynchosporium commune]
MLFVSPIIVAAAISLVSASAIKREDVPAVPLVRKSNVKSLRSLVQGGRSRIAQINAVDDDTLDTSAIRSGAIANENIYYAAPVTIGGEIWMLQMDTGSSTTWIGAQKTYTKSATGTWTGHRVRVTYGTSTFSGVEYLERVSFAGLTVNAQSIGVATYPGDAEADGFLGLGPLPAKTNVVGKTNVPTFMNNLMAQKSIQTEVFAISFRPLVGARNSEVNGELTIGGVDPSKFKGPLTYFPRLKSGRGSLYWGIQVTKFSYGSTVLSAGLSTGIVDTGTVITWIPTVAFNAFVKASGAGTDNDNEVPDWVKKPTLDLGITIGSTTYTLTPDQYLVPAAQYANLGLVPGKYYAFLQDGGSYGVNTILGQKFLEYYYSVYDKTNARVGFAANS